MLAAFLGSLLVSLLIYGISRSGHGNLSRLLLAGIAINALCMAAIGVLSYVSSDQQLRQFSLWMMGSLSQSQWPTLAVSASLILPAALLTLLQARRLNLLQLGDEEAHYLGVNVQRAKLQLLLLSALLIGAAVAMSGVIGFVGLVVPHLVRMRLGGDHRWLLPCSRAGRRQPVAGQRYAGAHAGGAGRNAGGADDQPDRRSLFLVAGDAPAGASRWITPPA